MSDNTLTSIFNKHIGPITERRPVWILFGGLAIVLEKCINPPLAPNHKGAWRVSTTRRPLGSFGLTSQFIITVYSIHILDTSASCMRHVFLCDVSTVGVSDLTNTWGISSCIIQVWNCLTLRCGILSGHDWRATSWYVPNLKEYKLSLNWNTNRNYFPR